MAKRRASGEDPLDLTGPKKSPRSRKKKRRATVKPSRPAAREPEPARERPIAPPGQYLTFFLAGEEYGAGILRVREIIEFDALTNVPTAPPWIRGVINLRGSVVPVIDLAVKFGLRETAITNRTCVVIVEADLDGEPTVMGVMVDAVSQVVELKADEIERAPAFGTRAHVDYLLGMGRLGEKLVQLLDVNRVLSSDELLVAAVAPALEEADGGAEKSSEDLEESQLLSTPV